MDSNALRTGDNVRPNTIGTDKNGQTIDHSYLRGTVVARWTSPGTQGEPVAAVRWTRGTYFGHDYTEGFPVACLERA